MCCFLISGKIMYLFWAYVAGVAKFRRRLMYISSSCLLMFFITEIWNGTYSPIIGRIIDLFRMSILIFCLLALRLNFLPGTYASIDSIGNPFYLWSFDVNSPASHLLLTSVYNPYNNLFWFLILESSLLLSTFWEFLYLVFGREVTVSLPLGSSIGTSS